MGCNNSRKNRREERERQAESSAITGVELYYKCTSQSQIERMKTHWLYETCVRLLVILWQLPKKPIRVLRNLQTISAYTG